MMIRDDAVEFAKRLEDEMETWQRDGLIEPDQKERILARYRIMGEAREKAGSGKMVTTLSILGAILVGIGVILFIASNWSEIPRWGRVSMIFGGMFASYGGGFHIRYRKGNYPKVGGALIFLGALIFGAGIFLIAQMYHITVHYPNGPLLWGIGTLPLAYLLRFRSILALALADLLIWLGMEASFHVSTAYGYWGTPLFLLFIAAGLLLWAIGLVHRGFAAVREMSGPYLLLAIPVTFIASICLTYEGAFGRLSGFAGFLPFYWTIAVLFFIAAAVRSFAGDGEKGRHGEIFVLGGLMCLVLFIVTFFSASPPDGVELALLVIFNLLYAGGAIGLIVLGYLRRAAFYINLGLFFFIVDVVARYFDFFWKLLPRSLFFIGGGAVLLSAGVFLEKKRRKVIESFRLKESQR
jgi:uncharacterized membrane protein